MKRWLAAAVIVALCGAVFAWRTRTPIVLVKFEMNAEITEGLFSINMPVDGQACVVDDLNFRNESVAAPVRDYWDIESRHRVVVLNAANEATVFIDVPTFLEKPFDEPVLAKSYCKPKAAGTPIALRIHRETDTAPWQMVMN